MITDFILFATIQSITLKSRWRSPTRDNFLFDQYVTSSFPLKLMYVATSVTDALYLKILTFFRIKKKHILLSLAEEN